MNTYCWKEYAKEQNMFPYQQVVTFSLEQMGEIYIGCISQWLRQTAQNEKLIQKIAVGCYGIFPKGKASAPKIQVQMTSGYFLRSTGNLANWPSDDQMPKKDQTYLVTRFVWQTNFVWKTNEVYIAYPMGMPQSSVSTQVILCQYIMRNCQSAVIRDPSDEESALDTQYREEAYQIIVHMSDKWLQAETTGIQTRLTSLLSVQ